MNDTARHSDVHDHPEIGRYEIVLPDGTATLDYRPDCRLVLERTHVPPGIDESNHRVAGQLLRAAITRARSERLTIVASCPFARRWLRDNREAWAGVTVEWAANGRRQDPITEVVDDAAAHRFRSTAEDGSESTLVYERHDGRLYLVHTEVPPALRGTGTGGQLVEAALETARTDGLTVVPWCPFAAAVAARASRPFASTVSIDWVARPASTHDRRAAG